jgi:hypothetical protein
MLWSLTSGVAWNPLGAVSLAHHDSLRLALQLQTDPGHARSWTWTVEPVAPPAVAIEHVPARAVAGGEAPLWPALAFETQARDRSRRMVPKQQPAGTSAW